MTAWKRRPDASFGSRIIAALVLAVAAYILLKVIIGFAAAIAGTIVDHRGDRRSDLGAEASCCSGPSCRTSIIAFFFGLAGGVVGKIKGSSFFLWFLISGLVPVIGLMAAVLYRNEYEEPERECPNCGKSARSTRRCARAAAASWSTPRRLVEQPVHSA